MIQALIIDTRLGNVIPIDSVCRTVDHRGDGVFFRIVKVTETLFSASALVQLYRNTPRGLTPKFGAETVLMKVRWTHPKFFLRKVAFFEI